jgi:hypothetical protein
MIKEKRGRGNEKGNGGDPRRAPDRERGLAMNFKTGSF